MRRRQHHARSRNGCDTCKSRHVRCDERLPYCRNCMRMGRECVYITGTSSSAGTSQDVLVPVGTSASAPTSGRSTPAAVSDELSALLTLSPATQQAWVAKTSPHEHAVYYSPPHQRGLSSTAVPIVQQAQEIIRQRPMPRDCLMSIAEDYVPNYNELAARFECVKHALVSFNAYKHFQTTKSQISEKECISHTCTALAELQKEIENFSPENADAIVTASIALAGTATDWEQWLVFVDGCWRTLSYIRQKRMKTVYHDLLRDGFPIGDYSPETDNSAPLISKAPINMQNRVREVIESVQAIQDDIGEEKWRLIGFGDLEKLAYSVETALSLPSESETYHKLNWLRTWMFWIELKRTYDDSDGDEQRAMTCHFYGLVLAVVPLFPERYTGSLTKICIRRMEILITEMEDETASDYGLFELLETARGN